MKLIKITAAKLAEHPVGAFTFSVGTMTISFAQLIELIEGVFGIAGVCMGGVVCYYTILLTKEKYRTQKLEREAKEKLNEKI